MNYKKLYLIIATTFGYCGLASAGQTTLGDSLTGSYTDWNSSSTVSGSLISDYGTSKYLTVHLEVLSTGFEGDLSQGSMSAQAAAGSGLNATNFGSGRSSITYAATITNTNTTAQAYNFSFNLGSSRLIAAPGLGTVSSAISALIAVNGSSIWSSSAALAATATVRRGDYPAPAYSFTNSGEAFASYSMDEGTFETTGTYSRYYKFNPFSKTISLGTLLPGQSEVITYQLNARADLSNPFEQYDGYGGAVAGITDPFNTNGSPGLQISEVQIAAVPEPESLAMMVAGLAMVGGMVRRRKQKEMV